MAALASSNFLSSIILTLFGGLLAGFCPCLHVGEACSEGIPQLHSSGGLGGA